MNLGLIFLLFNSVTHLVDSFFQNILVCKRYGNCIDALSATSRNGDSTEKDNERTNSESSGTMVKVKERLLKIKTQEKEVRAKTLKFAKSIVLKPSPSVPKPRAIAMMLKDAAEGAVDNVVRVKGEYASFGSAVERAETAFKKAEAALTQVEVAFEAISAARIALEEAKEEAREAISEGEAEAVAAIKSVVEPSVLTDISDSQLSIADVDFSLTEMAPPFINEDRCLVPGEPLVRVEKAPDNSRRIFAGVDIQASVDDIWALLTDYHNLQDVVPNLVLNEVLELYPPSDTSFNFTAVGNLTDEEQCQLLSENMKGAKLKQVGGAKVVGINFSARTTLEVREWPDGLPDFAHFNDELYLGISRDKRATQMKVEPLLRYHFPRPFAVSSLPTKDISMQSIIDDDGEFRLYQGVWRMQPLPGCAPSGASATRLTYAVELSPRSYLPVQLIEGRIAKDLCNNLLAIRNVVSNQNVI